MKILINYSIIFMSIIFLWLFFPVTALAQLSYDGDASGDGMVDEVDFGIWLSHYDNTGLLNKAGGDFDRNKKVDGIDYVIWLLSYGTSVPTPTPALTQGLFITPAELAQIPISGAAWTSMSAAAGSTWPAPDLKNQDNKHGLRVLAAALVYARTGDAGMRTKARDGIILAKRTMDESTEWTTTNGVLSLGRQLGGYVIAADLIDLQHFDATADTEFRNYLRTIRTTKIGSHGRWNILSYTCENSANNWGTFACPSRLAASLYLGDTADVQRVANIIRAYFGERLFYPKDAPGADGYFQHTIEGANAGWYCDAKAWTGINVACIKLGVNIDGALTEDTSRGGTCCALVGNGMMYSWEALQGLFVSSELLYRTGSFGNPYTWSNNALKRAMDHMVRQGWGVTNPAKYVPWMANKRYGTNYPTTPTGDGRLMSWGDWLYQK